MKMKRNPPLPYESLKGATTMGGLLGFPLRVHTWKTFLDPWPTTVADQKYHNLGIACYP